MTLIVCYLSFVQSQASHSRRSLELLAWNASGKRPNTKNNLLSTSATLASLYEVLLCFSVFTYFSKAQIFYVAIENGAVRSCTPIKQYCEHKKDGLHILRNANGAKTGAPQNNRAMEQNVNFLYATVCCSSTGVYSPVHKIFTEWKLHKRSLFIPRVMVD